MSTAETMPDYYKRWDGGAVVEIETAEPRPIWPYACAPIRISRQHADRLKREGIPCPPYCEVIE